MKATERRERGSAGQDQSDVMKTRGNPPGNAALRSGSPAPANTEIGVPGKPGNAALRIGSSLPIGSSLSIGSLPAANAEIGDPGKPGNANLRIGSSLPIGSSLSIGSLPAANAEIGDPGKPGNANLRIGSSAPANAEIGDPGEESRAPGWHSRGYLPHFDGSDAIQHVTFHLADSLPRQVVERLEKEVRREPLEKQDAARRKRVDDWIDAGHGCCILREPAIAEMVQSTFLFFDGQRYRLFAWVVMPNHVHVLFQPLSEWTLAKIIGSWKKFTATRICASAGNANLRIGDSVSANAEIGVPGKESGVPGGRIWHREYWDRYIRDEVHFRQVVDYIHANPVKAGLVARAEGWRWSSAAWNRTTATTAANREIGVLGNKP